MHPTAQLRIGYLMQKGAPDLSTVSGPQLHVAAVIKGLQKLGNQVRTVAIQQGLFWSQVLRSHGHPQKIGTVSSQRGMFWSDDLQQWHLPQYGLTKTPWHRLLESSVRRTQSELQLPFLGWFDSVRYADACVHLLKGYDLLYERHGYMGYGGVLAARWLGIPLVLEMNGNIIREIDEIGVKMSSTQRRIGRWVTHRTLLAADHIVVVAEALKQQFVAELNLPEEKISVVLNGVNVELFSQPCDEAQVRSRHQLPVAPTVTFVGSFQPWHGVDLLVASLALVRTHVPDVQLILVGDGAGRQAVVDQVTALGLAANVKLLGRLPQEEVAGVLSVSDVVVAPYPLQHSDIVGTPLKLLEYLAAGKAIVASTAPLHDIIHDGVTGLRVAPANAQALADGIVRLLRDAELRARLGENARRQAQKHSWDQVAERLHQIFVGELARKKSPIAPEAPLRKRTSAG